MIGLLVAAEAPVAEPRAELGLPVKTGFPWLVPPLATASSGPLECYAHEKGHEVAMERGHTSRKGGDFGCFVRVTRRLGNRIGP
jgi:hypothetical protein